MLVNNEFASSVRHYIYSRNFKMMQILYLIGNGFDISLGLETRYTDFCTFYQKIETQKTVLQKLKNNIKFGVETWADLELRLGEYTDDLKSYEEFTEIYDDLLEKFGDYLQDTEDSVDWNLLNAEKFKQYLCNPERSLMQREINEITAFKDNFAKNVWNIDIITFNYTRTIEKILDEKFTDVVLGSHHTTVNNILLRKVLHIHGDLSNMVLGVNDKSQIKNKEFHTNSKLIKAFIKEYNNRRQGHTVDEILAKKISQSDIICIFGSSLGETDKIWWQKIGQHLLEAPESILIIYTFVEITPKRAIHKKGDFEDDLRERFYQLANVNEKEQEGVGDRIYIRANTNMFSALIKEKAKR